MELAGVTKRTLSRAEGEGGGVEGNAATALEGTRFVASCHVTEFKWRGCGLRLTAASSFDLHHHHPHRLCDLLAFSIC